MAKPVFEELRDFHSAPAIGALEVTPNDSTDLSTEPCRAVWVGTAGNLKVTMADNTQVTFTGIPAGCLIPIRAKRVWATGTTAGAIVAVY